MTGFYAYNSNIPKQLLTHVLSRLPELRARPHAEQVAVFRALHESLHDQGCREVV